MAEKRRALLTDTERAILSGEKDVKDNYRYSIESRVRSRIRDKLADDLATLQKHWPEMFAEVVELVEDLDDEQNDG